MKAMLNALGIIALVNLLGLAALVGWLKVSDRLDRARVEQVRQLFAKTLAESRSDEAAKQAETDAAAKAADERAKSLRPVQTAEEQLEARTQLTDLDRQRAQRFRDELATLQTGVTTKLAELEALRAQITQAKQEFEDQTKKTRDIVGAEQFRKTLGVIESMKAEQAKSVLKEMLTSADGKVRVVSYLNAMEDSARTKVVQEFLKDDPKMAADLLEQLRVRGVPPALAGADSNDRTR